MMSFICSDCSPQWDSLMLRLAELTDHIEEVRDEMVDVGMVYGFLHPEVQHCSRKLDQLLNQFYELERLRRQLERD